MHYQQVEKTTGIMINTLASIALPNPDWSEIKPDPASSYAPCWVCNIASNPVELKGYVGQLEKALGKITKKELLPLQSSDVPGAYADVDALIVNFGYRSERNARRY